ncbi:MAG TPA: nucleotidyltransferase, partial [Ignavibacteria bacterium]
MANTHNIFFEFNKKIRLSRTKRDSLKISRKNLRDKIVKVFASDSYYNPIFYGQGSFTLDTIVNPINTGDYDIDDGVYFEVENVPEETPTTFHNWIYDAVEGYTDNISDKNPCVRVIFSDGHHVDLTIYYRIRGDHPNLAHKSDGWVESDPNEFINWFLSKLDAKKQLRRIVRYLKAWSDYKNLLGVSGLVLTILAAEKYI